MVSFSSTALIATSLATIVLLHSNIISVEVLKKKSHTRRLKKSKNNKGGKKGKRCKKSSDEPCDPANVNLQDYAQWQNEMGYWVGEYSFYGADGAPFVSASWNYPYDHYKGFITGNVKG